MNSGALAPRRSLSGRVLQLAKRWFLLPLLRLLSPAFVGFIWRTPTALKAPPRPGDTCSVALLSHGLGGHRGVHVAHALDLVRRGFIVAAVEHGDGTAVQTSAPGGRWRRYQGCGPPGQRWTRVETRLRELAAVADVLAALQAREAPPHQPELLGGDLALLRQLLPPSAPLSFVVVGHSFGGATALEFARRDARVRAAVAHDPWLPALAGAGSPAAAAAAAGEPWPRPCAVLVTLCAPWLREGTHDPAAMAVTFAAIRAAHGVAVIAGLSDPCNHYTVLDVPLMAPSGRAAVQQTQCRVFHAASSFLSDAEGLLGAARRPDSDADVHRKAGVDVAGWLGEELYLRVTE